MLSTGNVFTELQLDKSPNTLVIGTNGSGKSTMMDALCFVLFGKAFRDCNKPELVNSINDGNCVTEVEFRCGIKEYKIVRGIKPNIFEIYCDDKLINQDGAARDYQGFLEKNILKFDYKAFTQIVVLGAASFVPFMQLAAADRRAIIEDLLDIEIFTSMNVIVKERVMDIKNKAGNLKTSIDHTMARIDMQRKYVDEAKKSNQDQIEAKEKEFNDNNTTLQTHLENIRTLTQNIDDLFFTISDETIITGKLSKMHVYENQIELNKKKTLKEEKFYYDNDNCPTCRQDIPATVKIHAITSANTKIKEFNSALDTLTKEQNKLNERLTDIKSVQKRISGWQSQLTQINATVHHIRKYTLKLLEEINELKNKKVLSEDMTKVSEELLGTLRALQKDRGEISESKQYFEIAATLLKDNGIKAKIVKQYLPVINKLVNKFLTSMDFFVNFEIDEEFNETIKSRHRDNFSYGNFSEGEKMRIDLALLFTWRSIAKLKNSMSTNLLILDEVFDSSLDSNGIDEILKILNTLGADTSVFVISHKGDIMLDKFKSVIKFTKQNNFSRIE